MACSTASQYSPHPLRVPLLPSTRVPAACPTASQYSRARSAQAWQWCGTLYFHFILVPCFICLSCCFILLDVVFYVLWFVLFLKKCQNPLTPGAKRGPHVNPEYTSTYVFPNDFPSLNPTNPMPDEATAEAHPLMRMQGAKGDCRVMCTCHDHHPPIISVWHPVLRCAYLLPRFFFHPTLCTTASQFLPQTDILPVSSFNGSLSNAGFHPHSNVTLPLMTEPEIRAVIVRTRMCTHAHMRTVYICAFLI